MPVLKNRTLRLSPDRPGLEYQYAECAKRFLGVCVESRTKKELYDLTDAATRKMLIDTGFVVRVLEKP